MRAKKEGGLSELSLDESEEAGTYRGTIKSPEKPYVRHYASKAGDIIILPRQRRNRKGKAGGEEKSQI